MNRIWKRHAAQVARLETIFGLLDEKVRGKHCDGIAGIIEEGKSIMEEEFDEPTMDACLIAAGQRAEHYEMAAYGTLVAWATAIGHTKAAGLLQETLDEEKAADEKLSALAEGGDQPAGGRLGRRRQVRRRGGGARQESAQDRDGEEAEGTRPDPLIAAVAAPHQVRGHEPADRDVRIVPVCPDRGHAVPRRLRIHRARVLLIPSP